MSSNSPKGRGAGANPPNRFIPLQYAVGPDDEPGETPALTTLFFRDNSRTAIASNDSPDVPFTFSLNPYRGCEHGCSYCYARPTHEYLGFSAGLDFESRIVVKEDAPELLRKHFMSPKWQPETISISGVTDPYQPIERRLKLTRRCLEVFAEFRNPLGIVTKNALVARDKDLLGELAKHNAAAVFLSITTLDADLASKLEPRASAPQARLRAVRELTDASIPVGVMFAPAIPGLNDHEAPAMLAAAAEAGAKSAAFVVLRLPWAVKDIFAAWLEQHYPDRKNKVLNRVRELHGGELYRSKFGDRMRGEGEWRDTFGRLFKLAKARAGIKDDMPELSVESFRRPGELFS
ncbi:MAG: PA0069 family radical SAM protein [Gemmataceae bacterium]